MNLTGFKFFTVLILCITVQICAWSQNNHIRTGLQVMYGTSNTLIPNIPFTASQTPISFLVTYSSALGSPARSAGVGIVGYTSSISRDFSPNVTIQNFTISTLRLTLRVYGDTSITYFSVNWIAVGNSAHFIQILFNCYLPTNLDKGRGYRSDSFIGNTLFIGYTSLSVNVYLAGFTLNNGEGLTNYLSASANIPRSTNTINYLFATDQNNTITEICYTTIIFCKQVTIVQQYYDWGLQGNVTLSNQAAQNPTLFPTNNPPDYTNQNRMFFGMSEFSISRGFNRIFNLNTQSYNNLNLNYNTNVGTYAIIMDYFFLAVRGCNNSYVPVNNDNTHIDFKWFNILTLDCQQKRKCLNTDANSGDTDTVVYPQYSFDYCAPCNYTCQTCNAPKDDDCTGCNNNFFRYLTTANTCPCSVSYIDIGYHLCYPCQNFIAGCYTCTTTVFCTSCYPGFVLQPSGLCQCSSGFLVTGVCTNITGCTNILSYSGTLYCTACNSTLHFQVNSLYTCSCMTGYYISNNQVCLSSCGDGRQVTEQGCDDGNSAGGDGCSSTCFVQTNWTCAGGSPTNASYCRISNIFQPIITYVRRITSMNRMQLGIKIQPAYDQFTLISFKQYITTNVPCTDFNATFINGELVLDFDYNRTIEGQFFNLTLTLDPSRFANNTILNITIPTSGMNAKLTYDYNNNVNYPMQIIVIVLDVLAIIVMFISCISERMIGIQMIQTLQTILYTQAVMKTTPSSLSPLQMLRYASGYNQIHGTDYSRTYTFAFSLSSLGLQKQFLLSYNLMYILLMIVTVICIILKLKLTYHQKNVGKYTDLQDQQKNNKKIQTTTKIYNFIFERILFLIAFISMFLIIFALMLQLTDMSSEYILMSKQFNLLGASVATAILCTLICGVILNGCFPGTLIFPMLMKQYYASIYFIYQSTFIFVLAFVYTQEYVLYILAGMSFIFMFYNMLHRPYNEKFHTFVLIFHQILIMAVIGVYIFENLNKPTENEALYKILNGIIIALLYVVVGLNAYRLYKYYLFIKNRGWDQYGNEQNQYDYDKNYQQSPKYRQLKTPKDLNNTRIQQNYISNNQTQMKKTKPKEQIQLQPIKKTNKTNTKAKDVQDQTEMDWNYNRLADQQNVNPRYQATKREILPDTSRDITQDYNKKKTNQQNPRNEDNNYDDTYTVKQNKNKSPNKNNQINQTFNQNSYDPEQFDNPYDENGYAKKTSKNSEDNDPLREIKRKLRKDFNSKVKVSTLKQN